MNRDDVYNELNGLSIEELVAKYSKGQLQSFYKVLFDIQPMNSSSKIDLAYACWNFIADDKHTRDLCKNLI